MQRISHVEFGKNPVFRTPSLVESMGYDNPTEERFWYKHGDRLGIILWDKIDSDWSFVVLEKNDIGVFTCVDCGTSFQTVKKAEKNLKRAIVSKQPQFSVQRLLDQLLEARRRRNRPQGSQF